MSRHLSCFVEREQQHKAAARHADRRTHGRSSATFPNVPRAAIAITAFLAFLSTVILIVDTSSSVGAFRGSSRRPKIAFLFLTKGPLPLAPLWSRFFMGYEGQASVYIHASPKYRYRADELPPMFRGRQIPSEPTSWGDPSLTSAERRLLRRALLDPGNGFFVLLSESCIPLFNFSHTYAYIARSRHSFVASVDDPSDIGRPTYYRWREGGARENVSDLWPAVREEQWRKGDAWFELDRQLAAAVAAEARYWPRFVAHHRDHVHNGLMDEHYLPTVLAMLHGPRLANRTLTYTNWFVGKKYPPHPKEFNATSATPALVRGIRERRHATFFNYKNMTRRCEYNGAPAEHCYLFARKFRADALAPLLAMARDVMFF